MQRDRPTIAIITDWLANNYTDPIIDEATSTAHRNGANVVWLVDRPSAAELNSGTTPLLFDIVRPETFDAVLVISFGHTADSDSIERYCRRFSIPMCSLTVPWKDHPRIVVDNGTGMRAAVEHLVRVHGFRRIGFMRGPESSPEAEARYGAYRDVLDAHGIRVDPALVVCGDFSQISGHVCMRQLFERDVEMQALVCANDGMAYGAMDALRTRKMVVPDDIAIVGFDDMESSRFVEPPLTSVRQSIRMQARASMELLFEAMAGKPVPLERVIPSELVVRRSCGCAEDDEHDRYGKSLLPPPSEGGSAVDDWAEQLCAAMIQNSGSSSASAFWPTLETILAEALSREGDVGAVHRALTTAHRRVTELPAVDRDEARLATILLDKARVAIGSAAERSQGMRRIQIEDQSFKLTSVNRALSPIFDLPALTDAIASQLPWLGIPSLYLCLYDQSLEKAPSFRVVLAFKSWRRIELPPGGISFALERMLPDEFMRFDPSSTHVCCSLDRFGSAGGYVVFERGPRDGMTYDFLAEQIGAAMRRVRMFEELVREVGRRQAAERERLEKEMRIAAQIQTGILPRKVSVEGLEICAVMQPASEVGGDYYDVIPVEGGCWLGIGDVAGHGLATGLVMMMLQSVVGGLARGNPTQAPRDMIRVVNEVLFENIRERMVQDEHVTLTLFRYRGDGQVAFAGAHEDILFYRAATRSLEWLATRGTWVGARRDIAPVTTDTMCALGEGDLMVLYTDGVTEAQNAEGELFGGERLAAVLETVKEEPLERIRDALLAAVHGWMAAQTDDITLVIVRRKPAARG